MIKKILFEKKGLSILVVSNLWSQENINMVKKTIGLVLPVENEVSIKLSNDIEVRNLNYKWRKIDKATNVLSFASDNFSNKEESKLNYLGDIIIAYETVNKEAKERKIPLNNHLAHLALHGFLHLIGYDHVSISDAKSMECKEVDLLFSIGIPNPYYAKGEAK